MISVFENLDLSIYWATIVKVFSENVWLRLLVVEKIDTRAKKVTKNN